MRSGDKRKKEGRKERRGREGRGGRSEGRKGGRKIGRKEASMMRRDLKAVSGGRRLVFAPNRLSTRRATVFESGGKGENREKIG